MSRRHRVEEVIGRYFGSFRKSQRTTMGDLTLGLLRSGRIGQAGIARGMRDRTTVRHRIKRLWRFCRNRRIRPESAMLCLVRWLVPRGCPVVVALDWTYLTDYVMLAAHVAVAGRAVPVSWTVMKRRTFDAHRKSRNMAEDDLIRQLDAAMDGREWILVADRGFARADLVAKLQRWGIRFVIRAKADTWAQMDGYSGRIENLPVRARRAVRYDHVRYQKSRRVALSLVVTHEEPAAEAWYLLTNVEAGARAICDLYCQRMWIEESFRDAKSNLGLGKLWLATPERMERLVIVLALVMALSVLRGLRQRREHPGQDPQLTTKRKGHSLSVFLLGLHLIRQHGLPPDLSNEPLFVILETT